MILLLLVLLALFVVLLSCFWFAWHYKFFRNCWQVPGPNPLPIIGNALYFTDNSQILPVNMELKRKYGKLFRIVLGFEAPFLIVTDPKLMEFVLTSPKLIDKSIDYRFFHEWLGTGLLTSTGSKWKKHRKIITPAFHFKILESFVDIFEKNVQIMLDKWKTEVGNENFDVYSYVTLLTLDIICETALGTTVNAQIDANSDYVLSVKEMGKVIMMRSFSMVLGSDFLYQFSTLHQKEKTAIKTLHRFTHSIIQKRKEKLRKSPVYQNDLSDGIGIRKKLAFLDLLLQSTIDGEPLSDSDIREEADTFIFEGHDTTSSAISFTLYNLSQYPYVQERVMEEINSVFSDCADRSCTYSDLQNMKYLEAVIKETLRLYPSVPFYGRQLTEDSLYGDIVIPKGTILSLFPYGMHRDPDIFQDPETFNPDRFFASDVTGRNPFSYIPFSAGQRNCIGQKFAMLEMKCTISSILRHFQLLPAKPNCQPSLSAETILKSTNGIKIRIRKRTCDNF